MSSDPLAPSHLSDEEMSILLDVHEGVSSTPESSTQTVMDFDLSLFDLSLIELSPLQDSVPSGLFQIGATSNNTSFEEPIQSSINENSIIPFNEQVVGNIQSSSDFDDVAFLLDVTHFSDIPNTTLSEKNQSRESHEGWFSLELRKPNSALDTCLSSPGYVSDPELMTELQMSPNGGSLSDYSSSHIDSLKRAALCRICKNPGGKHFNFYGCQGACTSCRSFFRRSVQSGQYTSFVCKDQWRKRKSDDICVIDSKNRRSCKKCRFERCLERGMKIRWVQTGLGVPIENPEETTLVLRSAPRINFTIEELAYAKHIEKTWYDITFEKYFEIYGQDEYLLNNFIECNPGKVYPYDFLRAMEDVDRQICTQASFRVMTMENLDMHERCSLIQANLSKYIAYSWAMYSDGWLGIDFMINFIEFGQKNLDRPCVQRVMQVWNANGVTVDNFGCCYENVFASPWAVDESVEREHYRLTQVFKRWASASTTAPVDKVQITLFELILLLTVDDAIRLAPEQRDRVEQLQMKFVLMLQRYLKDKFPKDGNAKFAAGLMLLQRAKELHTLHAKRLPV